MCKETCKYYDEDEGCMFYVMGSGNSHDMPCNRDDEDVPERNVGKWEKQWH